MQLRQIIAATEEDTARFAGKFAKGLRGKETVFLRGPLGAGKSVFARALIRALTGDSSLEVPSPTFTLVQTYDAPAGPVWHFDLYRLKNPEEIYETGWEEALADGIVLVEWPERLGPLAPRAYIEISLAPIPEGRSITVRSHDDR